MDAENIHDLLSPWILVETTRPSTLVLWYNSLGGRYAMPFGVLSDFPTSFDGPLPLFSANGSLPPGDFQPSRIEFEARFVSTGDLTRKRSIYDGWNRHRGALTRAGVPADGRQLLNGSYTTAKFSPGDMDIAVQVTLDGVEFRALRPNHPVVRLLQGPLTKAGYDCDAYPIYSLPADDPLHKRVTVGAIEYWTKWFGRTSSGASKGRVWTVTGGLA